jgi:uncharacterized protein (DUF302 family)
MRFLLSLSLVAFCSLATAADGLISVKSSHSVDDTMTRLESIVKEKGFTVFAKIDHAAGAAEVGMKLRPTELLIFGNPKGGTPLMQCAQTSGIDMPMKALRWEDEKSQVWLSYNDLEYIAKRHGAENCAVVRKLDQALNGIVKSVVTE